MAKASTILASLTSGNGQTGSATNSSQSKSSICTNTSTNIISTICNGNNGSGNGIPGGSVTQNLHHQQRGLQSNGNSGQQNTFHIVPASSANNSNVSVF